MAGNPYMVQLGAERMQTARVVKRKVEFFLVPPPHHTSIQSCIRYLTCFFLTLVTPHFGYLTLLVVQELPTRFLL